MGGDQHDCRRGRGQTDFAKIEGCQCSRDRRISIKQDCAVMRILKLTPRTEKWLLARRAQQNVEPQAVAAEIVADVRKRGDAALFDYTEKFDHTDLAETGVWVTKK